MTCCLQQTCGETQQENAAKDAVQISQLEAENHSLRQKNKFLQTKLGAKLVALKSRLSAMEVELRKIKNKK